MINMMYKDRLFRFLFGNEMYKENTLSLYNALNGTNYDNADDIVIYTIEDVIYIKMKNDVAFLIDSYLSLWEQQSSYNPNMPLRGLMYFGKLYDKYIKENGLNIYGSKLIKIPTPKYTVFYNGNRFTDPVTMLKLSDAFTVPDVSGDFEWTATMYNLNADNVLLSACKVLSDYNKLVGRIKTNQKSMGIEHAVDKAVLSCIDD